MALGIISCLYFSPLAKANDEISPESDYEVSNQISPEDVSPPSSSTSNQSEKKEKNALGRDGSENELDLPPEQKSKFVNLNPETAFGPEVVTNFDFQKVSIADLTKRMQEITGLNIIIHTELKGSVTISAQTPITVGDAWKAYLTALNMNNYAIVKSGAFYKIVPAQEIRTVTTKIYAGDYTPDVENYVMKILPLRNISVKEVAKSFRPFNTKHGRIMEIEQTNTLIIKDTGENINQMVNLIKTLDVPGHEETLHILKIQHSSSQEIAKLLDTIIMKDNKAKQVGRGAINISKIIAEPRTNSIIALANQAGADKLKTLIKTLDVQHTAEGPGNIHVYYLNHSGAEDMAKTLSSIIENAKATGKTNFNKTEATTSFGEAVKITADKSNNALVINASPTDYDIVKSVIKKLDIPRDQVYVEGLVMETNIDKDRGFGISLLGAYGTGGVQKYGALADSSVMDLFSNQFTKIGGIFAGIGAGGTREITMPTGGKITVNGINGLITAVAKNSNANILSTPQIMVLDNETGEFEIGDEVPIEERSVTNNTTNFTTKMLNVVTLFKITPQITKPTRSIKLKIVQKNDDYSEKSKESGGTSYIIAKRKMDTTVVVRDRDTIAMGGLMRDKITRVENKVPLLGDIPLLGWLFKKTSSVNAKKNLLAFLTPKIIYAQNTADNVKDLLNRRGAHLKDVLDGEDSFAPTVKGLYEKADQQSKGPLYNPEEVQSFQQQNNQSGLELAKNSEPVSPTSTATAAPASTSEPIISTITPMPSNPNNNDSAVTPTPTTAPATQEAPIPTPDYSQILKDIQSNQESTPQNTNTSPSQGTPQ